MPWFVRPVDHFVVLVPDYMSDTVERCRREGWAEIPDPRDPVAPPADELLAEAPLAVVDTDPARTQARRDEAQAAHVKATKARNQAARKWIERKG